MAVTRRIIWLNDSEWSLLAAMAANRGQTISAVVRDLAIDATVQTPAVQAMTQVERDAILRRINK